MKKVSVWTLSLLGILVLQRGAFAEDENLRIIRQSVLGAGVGAVSSYASGGEAGKGALIGAGSQVIGNALLGFLTESPSQPQYVAQPQYVPQPRPRPQVQIQPVQVQPVQVQTVYAYRTEPVYVQASEPVYYTTAPQSNSNMQIIRNGLLGAGVGAISSYASGGKGGRGALIGAGTNVIGGALLELLTAAR